MEDTEEITSLLREDASRERRLLWLFLTNTLAGTSICLPAILLQNSNVGPRISMTIMMAASLLVGMALLATGRIRMAAHVSIALVWVAINITTWVCGGVERPTFVWNLLLLAIIALTVGLRVCVLYTAATLVVGGLMFYARVSGRPGVPPPMSEPVEDGFTQLFTLAIGAVYIGIGAHALGQILQSARRHAAAAQQHNEQLRREISCREKVRTELLIAKRAAEAANRAKDRFLAMVSHELRTPLTPVMLTLDDLGRDETLPLPLRDKLVRLHHHVQLEARLIDDLLDLSRLASHKFRLRRLNCDLHLAVESAASICRSEVEAKRIALTVRCEATHSHVYGDPGRLQQVLWNVLRNSAKFTGVEGRIVVRTWNERSSAGERILIEVRDNGIGIAPETLPRLFHIFEQGGGDGDGRPGHQGGLGIGLALSKAIVDAHSGVISINSDGVGKGTGVTIQLDAIEMPLAPACTGTAPQSGAPAAGPLRVLIVEDHAPSATTLKALLEREGHHVTIAYTISAAVQMLKRGALDLLISDLGLPDGDGVQLAAIAREHGSIPAIALSGYGMEEDIARTRGAGFIAHLLKPVSMAQLKAAMAATQPRTAGTGGSDSGKLVGATG